MAAGLTAEGRWVDVLPTKAKRSGAFSYGVYGVHPFVLMNYIGNLNSVSTLAHELGHAMHSWLASRSQTYTNSQYKIFVAEVASTFNESLLTHMLVDRAEEDRDKLYILGEWLDNYRQTVFRQAMFAEFEWRAHQMVEEGRPVTADALSELYLELLRRYHGHEQGVMDIEELYAIEWAYIPHFYRNFYVFTYSTGLISSTALAEKVLAGGEKARDAYLEALSLGGSVYPLEILQHAGADLLSPEPYRVANRVFEERLALAEKLVGKLGL
jgi:oligoendopeptidase F